MCYNWNRYYDPTTGRYITTDPIGFAGGDVNLYRYVGNGVVRGIDPWGYLTYLMVGGALDWHSKIVKGYVENLSPEIDAQYFGHSQKSKLKELIKKLRCRLGAEEEIIVIAHSWGADSAIDVLNSLVKEGVLIDKFVSIDPVGWFRKKIPLDGIAKKWVNADADPLERDFSDTVATIGRAYDEWTYTKANETIIVQANHGDFERMLIELGEVPR